MGNIQRVSHLCLKVSDIEKAEAFYVDVLGMAVVNRDTMNNKPLVVLGEGLGLTLTDEPIDIKTYDHIGIRVDNIDEIIGALNAAGVPIVSGPKKSPYGTSVYFIDPDGNRLECHDADRQ